MPERAPDTAWVERFHAGDQRTLEALYREHFATVERSLGRLLPAADRETIIHSVFLDLCDNSQMRESFRSGSFVAWIRTVARNRALDYLRRSQRESLLPQDQIDVLADQKNDSLDDQLTLNQLVNQMHDILPEKLRSVFDARFVGQQSQREAAKSLGIRRTTLAYRERKVRKILQRWARKGGLP